MLKISNFYLVGAIVILALMTSGCATAPIKDAGEQVASQKPPETKFRAFEKIYLRSTGINSALASHPANQKALARIDEHLFSRVRHIFLNSLTVIEANEQLDGLDKNSLLIEPFVDDIRFIDAIARTWLFQRKGPWPSFPVGILGRALCPDSYVYLNVTFTDLSQDKIIASPTFYQRVGAWAGFFATYSYEEDNAILTRIGDLACEYILLHLTEATGEEPSSREQPSDEKDAKNKKESDDVIDADNSWNAPVYSTKDSRLFHHPDCNKISSKDGDLITFPSKEDAIKSGGKPCPECNP